MATSNNLKPIHRYITTNDGNGNSTFAAELSINSPRRDLPDGASIAFCYGNERFPVDLNGDLDLQSYQKLVDNPSGVVIPNGFAFRIIDFPPGYESVTHRTLSVNFNVVFEGQLELTLGGGEKRELGPGDSAIQRAIEHSWRNPSASEWARMAAVVLPIESLFIAGRELVGTGVPGMDPSS